MLLFANAACGAGIAGCRAGPVGAHGFSGLRSSAAGPQAQKNRATVPVTLLKPTMPPRRQTRSPTGSPAFGTKRSALCEVCDSSGLAIGYKGTTLRTNAQPFRTKKTTFFRKTLPQADFSAVSAIVPCGHSLPKCVCGPPRGEARPAEADPPSHRLRLVGYGLRRKVSVRSSIVPSGPTR